MPEITKSFSDSLVESLPVKKSIQVYSDRHTPNLKLSVRSSGRKSYYFRLRRGGKDIKRKLGEVGSMNVAVARLLAEKMLREHEALSENSMPEEKPKPQKFLTIDDIFNLYRENELKYRATVAGRTHALEVAYKTHVKPVIGSKMIGEVNKRFARNFFKELESRGYCAHNKCLTVLKSAFNYVIDFEDELNVTENPFSRLKKMTGVTRNRYLSHEEGAQLLNALNLVDNQDMADVYRLALFTGARLSNIKSMEWKDLNLSAAIWLIPATRTKTKQHYEIALHKLAQNILIRRQSKAGTSNFVFPSRSKYGYMTGGDTVWKQAIKLAGLYHDNPNIRPRPHDLRRTFATWQIQSGADISVVSKALCHTSLRHTLIYAHTNVDQVRGALDGAFSFL